MLKVYDVRSAFQINRQQWQACGDVGYMCKDDSEVQKEKIILDRCPFDKAFQEIYNHYFNGLYADETMFLHRPYIGVCGSCRSRGMKIFANDAHTISVKTIYREREYVSLDWIAKHLTAEQAVQYFKDRGVGDSTVYLHFNNNE